MSNQGALWAYRVVGILCAGYFLYHMLMRHVPEAVLWFVIGWHAEWAINLIKRGKY